MRLLNRVLAVVASLALLVGGALVAIECILAGVGRDPWVIPYDRWYADYSRRSWRASTSRGLFIGLAAGGLVLLLLQLLRRRPTALALEAGAPGFRADLARRSLERSLARSVEGVDGVAKARATVSPDRARIRVDTKRRAVDLRPQVAQAADGRLQRLGLAHAPAVSVTVKRQGER